MSKLPVQTNSHIFTNKNGNTLMCELENLFSNDKFASYYNG